LGMNNNGTGLVLASLVLVSYPRVMVPIIFYNLVQHLVAGGVHEVTGRTNGNRKSGAEVGKMQKSNLGPFTQPLTTAEKGEPKK